MAHRAYRKEYERVFPHLKAAVNSFSQRLDRQCRLNGTGFNQTAFKANKVKMRVCQHYLLKIKPVK